LSLHPGPEPVEDLNEPVKRLAPSGESADRELPSGDEVVEGVGAAVRVQYGDRHLAGSALRRSVVHHLRPLSLDSACIGRIPVG